MDCLGGSTAAQIPTLTMATPPIAVLENPTSSALAASRTEVPPVRLATVTRQVGQARAIGRRGSTCWASQVWRTQACEGSSQIRQARSSPGPAMTLR